MIKNRFASDYIQAQTIQSSPGRASQYFDRDPASHAACSAEPRTAEAPFTSARPGTGHRISQIKRKRVEECFGWLKTIALLREVQHRGIFKVESPTRICMDSGTIQTIML
jgi:hypothetical protein